MATLVFLLADNDYTFLDEQIDGVQKAIINKIAAQVYVADDQVGTFVEAMISEHFGGYLIPSEYTGEIVYSEEITNNQDLLPECPSELSWDIVGAHLPKYHSRQDVCDSNDLAKYVDEYSEFDQDDETDLSIIAYIEKDCPAYLTKMQWAYHQMIDTETALYTEAIEEMNQNTFLFSEMFKGELGSSFVECVTSTTDRGAWMRHEMAVKAKNNILIVDIGEQGHSMMIMGTLIEIALAERFIFDTEHFEQDEPTIEPVLEYIKANKYFF